MNKFRLAKVTLTALLLTACSGAKLTTVDNPPQSSVVAAQHIEEQIGIYPAEFLTSYVDAIGRRLVTGLNTSAYTFRFKIIDRGEPNVFAAADGYIYVSRGLLALINSEDELAGILAHEIIHVTRRHQGHPTQHDTPSSILTSPGRVIDKIVAKDVINTLNAPLETVGGRTVVAYDHDQENEADRLGMLLAARAGYDPMALATALYNLDRTVTLLADEQRDAGFFDNHPTNPARIDTIERIATSISWTPSRPFAHDKQALLDRINGLTWGADNPVQGIFRGQQFMQPDMDFSITFPQGWKAVNTPAFVGAFAPDQQALVILGGADQPGSAAELAAAFIEKLHARADIEPAEARPVELNAGPAYLVRIEDTSGEQPVSIYYLWVNAQSTTFRFIAIGADSFRDQLRETVLSLRKMTPDEKNSIVDDRIRSVAANAGESLQSLTVRTGNTFSPELTAAVNGLPDTATLEQDQLIKILRREAYLR